MFTRCAQFPPLTHLAAASTHIEALWAPTFLARSNYNEKKEFTVITISNCNIKASMYERREIGSSRRKIDTNLIKTNPLEKAFAVSLSAW